MKKILSRLGSKKKKVVLHSKNVQQSQELQGKVDTSKLLNEKDGPDECTKRSNTPALTEDTPIRELWRVAYEKLREEDGELIKNYETELKKSVAASLVQMLPAKANQRDEMDVILRAKMDEIYKNVSSPTFVVSRRIRTALFESRGFSQRLHWRSCKHQPIYFDCLGWRQPYSSCE